MEPKSNEIMNFDERAKKFVDNLSTQPDDLHRGPMETVYTCAAGEQHELERALYTPVIAYLVIALRNCTQMIKEHPFKHECYRAAEGYENTVKEKLEKMPYMSRMLSNGNVIDSTYFN